MLNAKMYYIRWIYIYIYIYIYIIPAKEHQVVDRSGGEEILISETLFWKYLEYVHLILQNYKKLKAKVVRYTLSSFLGAKYV